ncbi:MAG TPA: hypothetical protein ENH59_03735 [Bacteroidetes bacterium]|nr:hypothetical protein [Bacteroidota bacterium]
MHWYRILSLAALVICLGSCLFHLIRLLRYGAPKDYSHKLGNTGTAIRYSFTGAMKPSKKESAYLHLPTYTAGLLYHAGTFLAIILFFLQLTGVALSPVWEYICSAVLLSGALSGTGILFKRMTSGKMRSLSCADDYFSNILVSSFQYITIFLLIGNIPVEAYYIVVTVLLLYVPLGKLRHVVYFFAARYQLGYFYGWRNSWPPSGNY